jgi:hypothetical protein
MKDIENMKFPFALLCAALLTVVGASSSQAGTIIWTANGSGSDGALSAEADFTITKGQIQVTITNLLNPATIISIGQAVSDLSFTLSNAPGTNSSNTASGQLVTVSSGSVTDVSGSPGRWVGLELGGFAISGNTINLEAIGHGRPTELILPSDGGAGYADANSSIGVHSPDTDGPATFTLNLSGVTTSTTISNVTFSFGTGPDTPLTGTPGVVPGDASPVPEPPTALMGGIAMLILGAFGWARKRRLAVA